MELKNTGDYVSVTLENDANALVIRYCISDSTDGAGLDICAILDIGGDTYDLELTSRYSWVYGAYLWNNDPSTAETSGGAYHFFDDVRIMLDRTYPAGTMNHHQYLLWHYLP